jgi:hypothetical protein
MAEADWHLRPFVDAPSSKNQEALMRPSSQPFSRHSVCFTFLVLTLVLLCGCSTPQNAQTGAVEVATTTAPEQAPVPIPAFIGSDRWLALWSSVIGTWELGPAPTSDEILGPRVYLLDLARMRGSSELADNDDPAEKEAVLELMRGGAQGLAQPLWNVAQEEWGWDLRDVDQLLYFDAYPAHEESVALFGRASPRPAEGYELSQEYFALLGRFDSSAIEGKLTEKGYTKYPRKEDTSYIKVVSDHGYFLGSDILIFGALGGATNAASMIELKRGKEVTPRPMETFTPHLEDAWGMLFAGGGQAVGWDTMAIGFWGGKPTTRLTFLYRYPSQEEASEDAELVKRALTNRAPYRAGRPAWSEMLKLEDVEVEGELLIVRASTDDPELIGTALRENDLGFMPIRAATTVATDQGGGWTLYEKPAKGYEVALPSNWRQVDINTESIESLIEEGGLDGSELAKSIRSWITTGGPSFWAFEPQSNTWAEFRLTRMPNFGSETLSLDEEAEQWAKSIKPSSRERVSLPAGEAERFDTVTQTTDESTSKPVEMRQTIYLMVAEEGTYLLVFNVKEDQVPTYEPIFDRIERSFRLTR